MYNKNETIHKIWIRSASFCAMLLTNYAVFVPKEVAIEPKSMCQN